MVDEQYEVEEWLNGSIPKECTFRVCLNIAKYYKEEGYEPIEIRKAIFKWANANNIYINQYLNSIITRVFDFDKKPLTKDITVYVSDRDIEEIVNRFDTKNVRLVALGLLCYAKIFSDEDNSFEFSQRDLANWLNMRYQNINKYFRELELFDYVKIDHDVGTFAWNKNVVR